MILIYTKVLLFALYCMISMVLAVIYDTVTHLIRVHRDPEKAALDFVNNLWE